MVGVPKTPNIYGVPQGRTFQIYDRDNAQNFEIDGRQCPPWENLMRANKINAAPSTPQKWLNTS